MPLMDRIIFRDFLNLSPIEQLAKICDVQALRTSSIEEARVKKGGKTKSAKRNLQKRGVKVKDPTASLAKLLKGMSPAQIAKIKESYGLD